MFVTWIYGNNQSDYQKYALRVVPWAYSIFKLNVPCILFDVSPKEFKFDWRLWKNKLNLDVVRIPFNITDDYNNLMSMRFDVAIQFLEIYDANQNVCLSESDVIWRSNPFHHLESNISLAMRCYNPKDYTGPALQFPRTTQDFYILFKPNDYAKMFFQLCRAIFRDCKHFNYPYWSKWESRKNGFNSENIVEIVMQIMNRSQFKPITDDLFNEKGPALHYPEWKDQNLLRQTMKDSGIIPSMQKDGIWNDFVNAGGNETWFLR